MNNIPLLIKKGKVFLYVLYKNPYSIYRRFFFLSPQICQYFRNKRGIRIGGKLRWKFKYLVKHAREVIDVNVSNEYLGKLNKIDYLTDATNLYFAKNEEFDFVCSSHLLEHLSNPIKALYEWLRVIKRGGIIYCAIPDKRFTFDNKRQKTALSHVIEDYKRNVSKYDFSHVREFIANWEKKMDSISEREFINLIKSNPLIYIHHHVWEKEEIIEIFKYIGLKIVFIDLIDNTVHIVGEKQ